MLNAKTVLDNKQPNFLQWFLDRRPVKWTRWFLDTNFFALLIDVSFTTLAIIAAIATGGWLLILLAALNTTILVSNIGKYLVDAQVECNRNNTSSLTKFEIKEKNSVEKTVEKPDEKDVVKITSLARIDKANNYFRTSISLLIPALTVTLPLTGMVMGLLGSSIPIIGCTAGIISIMGGIILGSKAFAGLLTVMSLINTIKLSDKRAEYISEYTMSEQVKTYRDYLQAMCNALFQDNNWSQRIQNNSTQGRSIN